MWHIYCNQSLFNYVLGVKPNASSDKDKKKQVEKPSEKNDKEKEKGENNLKKKPFAGGAHITSLKPTSQQTANKEKESGSIKLRRKSSTVVETNNPVVLLRRKSFAGATEALRKKGLENGVNSSLSNSTKSSVS